jgi:NADH dehydrogenase
VLEIAGPETLTARAAVARALEAGGRPRRLARVPTGTLLRALHLYEAFTGPIALATRDEAEALGATMVSARGTADAEALGVSPLPIAQVLAA